MESGGNRAEKQSTWKAFIGDNTPGNYIFWLVSILLVAAVAKEINSPSWVVHWSSAHWGHATVDPILGIGIGLVAGFMGGSVGAFISLFSVPLYTLWLGIPVKIAVGTNSLAASIIGLFAALVHFRKGTPNLKIAWPMMVAGVIGAAAGSYISLGISPVILKVYFSVVVFAAAAWMIYRGIKPKEFGGASWVKKAEKRGKRLNIPIAEGEWNGQKYKCDMVTPAVGNFFIAILAGIMGVGGGFIFTPMLHTVFELPMVVAIGTGNFVKVANIGSQFIIRGVADTVIYPLAVFAMVGGYFGANIGKRLALAINPNYLRMIFGLALLIVGLRFAGVKLW